jgi:hypothetical protein
MPCRRCTKCGTLTTKRCGDCRFTPFCSVDCFAKGWPEHKYVCFPAITTKDPVYLPRPRPPLNGVPYTSTQSRDCISMYCGHCDHLGCKCPHKYGCTCIAERPAWKEYCVCVRQANWAPCENDAPHMLAFAADVAPVRHPPIQ